MLAGARWIDPAWLEPGALGLDLCWFRGLTGWPCPGCGLTRSLAAFGTGDLGRSFAFHPFGPLLGIWAMAAALSPLVQGRLRERSIGLFDRYGAGISRGYGYILAGFVSFGLARLLLVAVADTVG